MHHSLRDRLYQSAVSLFARIDAAATVPALDAARLSRRAIVAGAVLCLTGYVTPVAAQADAASKLTAREVVRELFLAEAGKRVDLSGRDLSGLDLSGVDFKGADLSQANLFGANLTEANLAGADLTGAVLDRTVLVRTDFTSAVLRNASMLRPSVAPDLRFVARDLPSFRNADLRGVRITARLGGADFSSADLSGADFAPPSERGLGGTPTHGLARSNFAGATLVGTNMAGLTLSFSTFAGADLRDANLSDADLSGADLTRANLTGTNLTGADLNGAKLDGAAGIAAHPHAVIAR